MGKLKKVQRLISATTVSKSFIVAALMGICKSPTIEYTKNARCLTNHRTTVANFIPNSRQAKKPQKSEALIYYFGVLQHTVVSIIFSGIWSMWLFVLVPWFGQSAQHIQWYSFILSYLDLHDSGAFVRIEQWWKKSETSGGVRTVMVTAIFFSLWHREPQVLNKLLHSTTTSTFYVPSITNAITASSNAMAWDDGIRRRTNLVDMILASEAEIWVPGAKSSFRSVSTLKIPKILCGTGQWGLKIDKSVSPRLLKIALLQENETIKPRLPSKEDSSLFSWARETPLQKSHGKAISPSIFALFFEPRTKILSNWVCQSLGLV